jgi:hypothetical protein
MTDHPETTYESVIPYCCDPNAGAVPLGIVRNVNRKPRTKRTSQDSTFIGRALTMPYLGWLRRTAAAGAC